MKKKQLVPSHLRKFSARLISLLIVLSFLISCSNSEQKFTDAADCVVVDRATIETEWVNSGDVKDMAYVKFFSSYLGPGTTLQVSAFGEKKGGGLMDASGIDFTKGKNCVQSLPGNTLYVPNYAKLEDLKILDANGGLVRFDYMRLTPITYSKDGEDYVCYNVYLVTGSVVSFKIRTDPCPPLCPTDLAVDNRNGSGN